MMHFLCARVRTLALAALLAGALSACERGAPDPAVVKDGLAQETQQQTPAANALTGEVTRVAGALAQKLDGGTIAVLDFADLRGQVTQLGTYVSEQITTELVRSGKGRVLERKQVLQVLEELNLRKANLSSDEVELAAQQLGADIIVVGSASAVGRNVEGNIRAVRVNGASLVAAERFSAAAPDEILSLSGQAAPASGSTAAGAGGPGAPGAPNAPVTEATVGPVQAVLNECRAAGSVVNCGFTFTSATVDAGLEITNYYSGGSEVRDEGGNAYRLTEFTFGSENGSNWSTILVARETTPGRLMITGVPITMTRLTRISLGTNIHIGERQLNGQWMVFRNVPIAR